MTAHTEPGAHPMVRSWYYKACCSGCGNVSERGPFVSRYKPDDVVELVCQVCVSAPFKALIEQRDRMREALVFARRTLFDHGDMRYIAMAVDKIDAVLASSGERGK